MGGEKCVHRVSPTVSATTVRKRTASELIAFFNDVVGPTSSYFAWYVLPGRT